MKKNNNKGFILAETLIVTAFVAGVLIFLYIQFTNLNQSYEQSYVYNTVEGLYALEDVKTYIETDTTFVNYIDSNINSLKYIDITDCTLFTDETYCLKLFELENIKNIFITHNLVPDVDFTDYDLKFQTFIKKINKEGIQTYRIVAEFNDSTYATVRFGD